MPSSKTNIRELEPCYLGKGCILRMFEDDSKSGSYEAKWSETTYDGAEGSDVLEVPVHWHAEHDEYVQVLEGRLTATINGKATILDSSKGLTTIPRYHTHGFKAFKGERVTAKEYTYPAGKYKELYVAILF
jgi:mannose-6-phosphate isomerase-like protein (cupin superfamily)